MDYAGEPCSIDQGCHCIGSRTAWPLIICAACVAATCTTGAEFVTWSLLCSVDLSAQLRTGHGTSMLCKCSLENSGERAAGVQREVHQQERAAARCKSTVQQLLQNHSAGCQCTGPCAQQQYTAQHVTDGQMYSTELLMCCLEVKDAVLSKLHCTWLQQPLCVHMLVHAVLLFLHGQDGMPLSVGLRNRQLRL